MNPMIIMGIVLAISLAGNAFLFHSRDAALEGKATAETALTGWKSSAETCSKSVDKLAGDGKKRHQEILDKLDSETGRIKGLQHDALNALAARPDDPKDLCGSIARYFKAEIQKERGAK